MSIIALIHPSSVPSIHLSNDEYNEIWAEFPGSNYGLKFPVEIIAKIPDNVNLALHQVKFLEKTHGVIYWSRFHGRIPVRTKWVLFLET